jgi:hypothetical protein
MNKNKNMLLSFVFREKLLYGCRQVLLYALNKYFKYLIPDCDENSYDHFIKEWTILNPAQSC